jgi:aspartyl protease family protein
MVRFLVIGAFAVLSAAGLARELTAIDDKTPQHAAQPEASAPPSPAANPGTYGEASIAKSGDGQFWVDATVNGRPVRFLVDTGASNVALTANDARSLGIDPASLSYSIPMKTANGMSHAALVKLSMVSVGRAEVEDVDAVVIDQGLETSLLGMSYLGRLSKFEATQDALVLKS